MIVLFILSRLPSMQEQSQRGPVASGRSFYQPGRNPGRLPRKTSHSRTQSMRLTSHVFESYDSRCVQAIYLLSLWNCISHHLQDAVQNRHWRELDYPREACKQQSIELYACRKSDDLTANFTRHLWPAAQANGLGVNLDCYDMLAACLASLLRA
jgi:hypothetical protein